MYSIHLSVNWFDGTNSTYELDRNYATKYQAICDSKHVIKQYLNDRESYNNEILSRDFYLVDPTGYPTLLETVKY